MKPWSQFVIHELGARMLKNELAHTQSSSWSKPPATFGWIKHQLARGYTFGPIQFYAKNKISGTVRALGKLRRLGEQVDRFERLLGSHGLKDRELLQILDRYLSKVLEDKFSKHSFAYRKRAPRAPGALPSAYVRFRSPKMRVPLAYWGALRVFIAEKHMKPYVVKLDLKAFFDSIPHDLLLARLYDLRLDLDAIDLVRRYLGKIAELKGDQVGILQGSSISGTLANVFLHNLDLQMAETDAQYLRYADDITLMASNAKTLWAAYQQAIAALESLDLCVNIAPEKSQWAFLGKGRSTELKGVTWLRELSLLGFNFDKTDEWWIRPSTMERALERIRQMTNVHDYRGNPRALHSAVAKINYYLGYQHRPKCPRGAKRYRISKPYGWNLTNRSSERCRRGNVRGWKGWVSCFSRVGYSPVVEMQMYQLDLFAIGRLSGMQRLLGGPRLSKKVIYEDLGLRSASGLYRIKAPHVQT